MLSIARVLHPTDFSETAEHALNVALDVAVQAGAELSIIHSDEEFEDDVVASDYIGSSLSEVTASRLSELVDSGILKVHYDLVRSTNPATSILSYADGKSFDLTVLGTRGHGRLWTLLLGSVAETVLRQSESDVLVVHGGEDVPGQTTRHIVVPVDFSERSANVLSRARAIAESFSATLHLLFVAEEHVVPIFTDTGIPSLTWLQLDPEIREKAEAGLKQLYSNSVGPDVPVTFNVKEGSPAQEIVDFTSEMHAGFVCMAIRGHSNDSSGLLGSVTERVVRTSPCPVWGLRQE
ncbi:MAG: universal stress protein [Rhodothermales bacterium]|nr:universal stress protein [Rhodothermales bacterium]